MPGENVARTGISRGARLPHRVFGEFGMKSSPVDLVGDAVVPPTLVRPTIDHLGGALVTLLLRQVRGVAA